VDWVAVHEYLTSPQGLYLISEIFAPVVSVVMLVEPRSQHL